MTDLFTLDVLKQDGSNSGRQVDLSLLNENVDVNAHVIYLAIKSYLANQRQGTHKAKERSEIAGSTKKLFRQKGTGGARRGDIKSPLLRGGGRVFGPKPNGYDNKLNKKEKKLAFLSALKCRLREQNVSVVDKFEVESPKTRDFVKLFDGLLPKDQKSLIIIAERNENLLLASRNIQTILIKRYTDVSVYDIVSYPKLFLDEPSVNLLVQTL